MNHHDLKPGMLRAHLDRELDPSHASAIGKHLESCALCAAEAQVLESQAAFAYGGLDQLPCFSDAASATSAVSAWSTIERKREHDTHDQQVGWSPWKLWSLAGGSLATAVIVILTVAPVRAWAENLLAVFRVEHFTVLELNAPAGNGLQNNAMLNQTVGHILSDEVTVTQAPQKARPVADQAAATALAGFPVKLLAGRTPSSLMLEGGAGAQMKLDRDRLQSILDEAGRNDLRIPPSVDGAIIGLRVPPGIMARYGRCGGDGTPGAGPDDSCLTLMQLPSPIASMPQGINPAQLAQVALEFFGMSSNDAASFTQTVDWTSTLVLPVMRGQSTYEQVHVDGNDGVLLRPKGAQPTGHFMLMWVDSGIVYVLDGTGDDTTALNLTGQLE